MAQKLLTDVPGIMELLQYFEPSLSEEQYGELVDLLLDIFPDCSFMPPAPGQAADHSMRGNKVDKMAFDAAVQTAFAQGANDTVRKIQAIRQAEIDVKPYVGEVMGMDSAGAVFKAALNQLGHTTSDLPLSAMGDVFHAVKHQGVRRVAMDAASVTELETRFGPGVFALKRR